MNACVEIDDKDVKIIKILIRDARTRLKDIAKECQISSVSVLNRIKRLRKIGVITGATLLPDLTKLGLPIVATVGVVLDGHQENDVIRTIGEQTNLVEPSSSIGKYDVCALVFAESIAELNRTAQTVRKNYGAREVALNIWSGAVNMSYENINLQPNKRMHHGQT
jgi:DNA-binding Lrp family transcriptional regulator